MSKSQHPRTDEGPEEPARSAETTSSDQVPQTDVDLQDPTSDGSTAVTDPGAEPDTEARIVREASHRANWLAIALGLMALASTGSLGWFGFLEWKRLNATVAALETAQRAYSELSLTLTQLTPRLDALEPRTEASERRAAAIQAETQAALARLEVLAERVQTSQVDTRESYVLAEAEYLLKLAQQRLLIERSPGNALTLMRTADALLAELADPRLQPVREALAVDMQALAGVPELDVLGVQAKLTAMVTSLDELTLPVRRVSAPVAELPTVVQPILDRVSQYITIHRLEAPIMPLVSAADAGRAREVLRLQLEQLKLAILREEPEFFASTRQAALSTLEHYFEVQTGVGAAIHVGLDALETVPVSRVMPLANQGLERLKAYRQQWLDHLARARAVESAQ